MCFASGNSKRRTPNGSSSHSSRSPLEVVKVVGLLGSLVLGFFGLVSILFAEEFVRRYIAPQMKLHDFPIERHLVEQTYPRTCHGENFVATAKTATELKVPAGSTAREHMAKHGAVAFDDVLSRETALELKRFILEENERNVDHVGVYFKKNRRSFELQIDHHPSVAKASKEILSNKRLVADIESIVGKNPAITEVTCITSFRSALEQPFHSDPLVSVHHHARSLAPAYSFFVPLQDTTEDMGATQICPGSQVCSGKGGINGNHMGTQCDGQKVSMAYQQPPGGGNSSYWPLGQALLFTQVLQHRAAGHSPTAEPVFPDENDADPSARVVFYITFAPRPRFGPLQVETRTFGKGGTSGLHWAQWGFTLRDYQFPERYLQWPWRIFRSLGIYKPAGTHWGWDYMTHAMRSMGQQEYNYYKDSNFQKMMMTGSGHWLLPKFLGTLREGKDAKDGYVALHFYIDALKRLRGLLLWVYVALLVASYRVVRAGKQHGRRRVATTFTVVSVLHVFILCLAWWCLHRISKTSWARNIQAGRLYHPVTNVEVPLQTLNKYEWSNPTVDDVLVLDHVRSEYLNIVSDELDIAHRGNQVFWNMAKELSPHFDLQPSPIQDGICSTLLGKLKEQGRRVMATSTVSTSMWTELDREASMRFCHKEMMRSANPLMGEAILHLDYLLSETRYGYFRDTALHEKAIPPYLHNLQDLAMGYNRDTKHRVQQESGGLVLPPAAASNRPMISAFGPSTRLVKRFVQE